MLTLAGSAAGMTLTGQVYEPDEDPPRFSGTPDVGARYVWVCDEFYEVASGGATQRIGDREIRLAFEAPIPRGFDTRKDAIAGGREHLRTQFARIGIPSEDVTVELRGGGDA